ncbi:MAG TPA: ABC transporter ATP-binding protein/permease [Gammaproteobacteria bacterium]
MARVRNHDNEADARSGSLIQVLRTLLPYVLQYRTRVGAALALMVIAKLAAVTVPWLLKVIIDTLSTTPPLALPAFLLIMYALVRFSTTLFSELRDALFARVTYCVIRSIALRLFEHLHRLGSRFHLSRQTGGVSRDIDRGTRAIGVLLGIALFNVLPTLVEIILVMSILLLGYDDRFSLIVLATLALYTSYTLFMTERRTLYRRAKNQMDSRANTRAIDTLINFEAVKYFGNERYEARRYGRTMQAWCGAAIRDQTSLSQLNIGQSGVIAVGVAASMLLAGQGVVEGGMTIGDLVLVNAYVIQICLPLNFLGFAYREIRDSVTDTERIFQLLDEEPDIRDRPDAPELRITRGSVRFEHVSFSYSPTRPILTDVDFTIAPGETVAVVGGSGAGKSTLARLLFRFYDVSAGRILIDDQDIRSVTLRSLRGMIGIVPQDTVLFNDSIGRNIAYGRMGATRSEIVAAAKAAQIHEFIESLPDQYATLVGERGLKLSGGERQRISIARAILKNPPILIFDEATSALDSAVERAIQEQLETVARDRTTLIVAHRLSTVVDADCILVMERGRIVESGTHSELLERGGAYTRLWELQQQRKRLERIVTVQETPGIRWRASDDNGGSPPPSPASPP